MENKKRDFLFSIFLFVKFEINMKLPLFYMPGLMPGDTTVTLDEPTSKHVVQVLRMETGRQLQLTDGKGSLHTVEITDDNRKKCIGKILSSHFVDAPVQHTTIAISPVKNASRFEWFLEKATEIGVREIVPMVCDRTEKQQFKFDRMQNILVSAMLQSQQVWLPVLREPIRFEKYLQENKGAENKHHFIAHCEETGERQKLSTAITPGAYNQIILIGPEGDFTINEIELALASGFIPVALGNTRLRTETAGIVAATLLAGI
jgi:16S rRNA (uracil1498-N3)-methyltransferase